MKRIKDFSLFKESVNTTSDKRTYTGSAVSDICVAMLLLNNTFLDNILDRGLRARYQNSNALITDLKALVFGNNRLKLGIYSDEQGKFVEDTEISKVNEVFEGLEYDIEEDFNVLVTARVIARNIMDKLIPDTKLTEDKIKCVYWICVNKTEDFREDIVVELTDNTQYSIFLNKSLTNKKTASFNRFLDQLVGDELVNLYDGENLPRWNKMVQSFCTITYENVTKEAQGYIEKFIDPTRISSIEYFNYFEIKHKDPQYKHLGEYFKSVNKNILYLSDLLNELWKSPDIHFTNYDVAQKEWHDIKNVILNSKILEKLINSSLNKEDMAKLVRLENGMKRSVGSIKMKFMRTIVEKLGCTERNVYLLSNKGNNFYYLPSRQFFRDNYDRMDIDFDYHVTFDLYDDETGDNILITENKPFSIKMELRYDESVLLKIDAIIDFQNGAFSNKLGVKYIFDIPSNFNYLITKHNYD